MAAPAAPAEAGDERLTIGGSPLRLEWHDLDRCPLDLRHLDSVVRGLVASGGQRDGFVVGALDEADRVVGAAGVDFAAAHGAYGAVAVVREWRNRGLGAELARRIVEEARSGGARYLTCRCPVGAEDAERATRLFGQECVSKVQVAFQQLLVLRLTG